jgi:hypothetical protein
MRKRSKSYFVIALVVIALGLSGAYALLATTLNITGTAQGLADFKISFTSATVTNPDKATANINADGTVLTITADLTYPGDAVTTNFTISNVGALAATVNNLTINNNSNADIIVEIQGLDNIEGTTLPAGGVTTGSVVVRWDPASTTATPEDVAFNITLDYLQATT